MSDPIAPFRAEFARLSPTTGNYMMIIRNWENHGHSVKPSRRKFNYERYRAAKTLQIAETQGPDAALLWKLSN